MGASAKMGGGEPVNIPTEALPLLLMQRTRLQAELAALYYEACAEDFRTIRDYVPDSCHRILDIGCGLGGLDVILARHLLGEPRFYLLDHDRVDDPLFYGYANAAPAYNSLVLTRATLEANGVDSDAITLLDAAQGINLPESVDLVLSIRSWGYHYPVTTYLQGVFHALAPNGGRLILDVRRGTDGMAALTRYDQWEQVEVIHEDVKFQRVMCELVLT